MSIEDTWFKRDGSPSALCGQGMRWRVRYRDHPSKSFPDSSREPRPGDKPPKPVQVYWARLLSEPQKRASDVTVGDLLDRWLRSKSGLSKSGLTGCRISAARARQAWDVVLASEVTAPAVREWLAGLPNGASSRIKTLQALSGALQIAVEEGAIPANPCAGVKPPRETPREAQYLTAEQLRRLRKAAGPDEPLIMLLGTTGLRIGEAAALNVGDIDKRRGRLRVRTSKNGEARDVAVAPAVMKLLDLGRPRSEPLFVGPKGARLNPHHWRARKWQAIKAAAGVPVDRPHDLRHTAVSLAIAAGADVKVVQRMVGHRTMTMTGDRYAHLYDHALDAVAARMNDLLDD